MKFSFLLLIAVLAEVQTCSAQADPQQPFQGLIGRTLKESTALPVTRKTAKPGSPNIVWMVLDDVGYGASSSFGGLIETPTLDSLANQGLRYTNFHVEAYCSPTRAALLTGRNHHSVHMGLFPETANEYPGYDARMPFEKGTVAEVLRENGYNTFAVGKWHVTPVSDATQAGPFNRWPTGRGFDHFYGFLFGETDQYHPQLWENNIKVPQEPQGRELNELLADKAIHFIADQKTSAPDKPFFLYFATGAMHEPHQVDEYWRAKYKGKFDFGWDKYRDQVLANQKRLKLVPQNAGLPKNAIDRPWDSLSVTEKKVYARFFENYAGFLSYTDYEIGRVINYIRQIGQLENTAIFVLIGDNGASGEGSENGRIEYINDSLNDGKTPEELLVNIDKIGTADSKTHQPRTWATATSTPFRQWKGYAGAEGGTHDPLIVFYPKGIREKGGVRNQYAHVIDILPTTLDITHASVPEVINGYPQDSLEGYSFYPSINNAGAVSAHKIQYYEVAGRRAIYEDGWKASADHQDGTDLNKDKWELYNINEDFNERFDLAKKYPDKLKALQDVFDVQAIKYNIYPLKDWNEHNFFDANIPTAFVNARSVVFYPGISTMEGAATPVLAFRSFSITADAEITSPKTEGVLFAYGSSFDGFSLFIKEGHFYAAKNNRPKFSELVSSKPVPIGKVRLRYEFNYHKVPKADDIAGTQALYINDEKVAELPIQRYQAYITTYDEGIEVGEDLLTPVSNKYTSPFRFTGKIEKITLDYK